MSMSIFMSMSISMSISISMSMSMSMWASLVVQLVKNPPEMQETPVQFLGQADPLEKGHPAHPSIPGLPWCLRW